MQLYLFRRSVWGLNSLYEVDNGNTSGKSTACAMMPMALLAAIHRGGVLNILVLGSACVM
jgi:hypothetical protein